MKRLFVAAAMAALVPLAAQAESNLTTNASGTISANARLNFTVTVPRVLSLQVGTAGTAQDNIQFTVPTGSVGAGTAGVTTTGGDLSPGAVTVRVSGNVGDIKLINSVTGPMTSATSSAIIPWSEIQVTSAALTTGTTGFTNSSVTHPAFNIAAGGGPSSAVTLAATNGVVRQEGSWTFAYANANFLPGGVYGFQSSSAVNNGTVTYTASNP